ncbi:MAG: RNA-guided endonuclease InsQ/TnpB family protein [Promethearchaeota archaeon]
MRVYAQAVQFCVDTAWQQKITHKTPLHAACYSALRERFGLHSQLCCNAHSQALEMVKKARSKPQVSEELSIRYNFPRCASVRHEWSVLSLATLEGRVKFTITLPEVFEKYLDWKLGESTLIKDYKGRFFFCFTFSKEVTIQPYSSDNCKILGVDLGVNTLAVTSDDEFFGSVKQQRIRWERLVAELQSKSTRAATRKLQRANGRWKRFMSWVNHNVSKKIVEKLSEGDVLVMEDLTHIRKTAKYNRWVHTWAFRELQMFLEYKATLKGVRGVYVSAHYTSKECNRCHSRNTSRHRGFFACHSCGHSLNSDLNGARNIARRYTRIIGLGFGKHAHVVAYDEGETLLYGSGLIPSAATSPLL